MGKPWENGGLMGFNGIYPLVMTNIAVENHHCSWKKIHYEWPFSTTILNYRRVATHANFDSIQLPWFSISCPQMLNVP